DHERKAAEYRPETQAYVELSDNPLEELITNVTKTLKELKDKKQLPLYRYNLLVPNRDAVKLSYMSFNPKAHKEGTPLRPIMNTIQAPTRAISDFLDQLIRPIYNEQNKANTIIDGVNLIKRLEKYVADGHLKASTLFCIFDINNLFTMLPQDASIQILGEFLREHVRGSVKSLSVTTIQKSAEIILKENAFVCHNQFYKQVVGGAMGSPFTLTLANIFVINVIIQWVSLFDTIDFIHSFVNFSYPTTYIDKQFRKVLATFDNEEDLMQHEQKAEHTYANQTSLSMIDRARYTYIEHLKGARLVDQLSTTSAIQSFQHLNIHDIEFKYHNDQLNQTFLTHGYAIWRRQITTKITQEHQKFFTKLFTPKQYLSKNQIRSLFGRLAKKVSVEQRARRMQNNERDNSSTSSDEDESEYYFKLEQNQELEDLKAEEIKNAINSYDDAEFDKNLTNDS
ncbi:unnamed protein product, partial [Didymodactylos carnosus]